jgi:hypothetical protein
MDSPAVVRAQDHSPARDGACQTSRNRSAARSVPTSRNRPWPQAPAPSPGHRHSPKYRTGTHPWIRGKTPRGPIAGSHTHPTHNLRQPVTRHRVPTAWYSLCSRPMRSQVEVRALLELRRTGSHVLHCELVKSPFGPGKFGTPCSRMHAVGRSTPGHAGGSGLRSAMNAARPPAAGSASEPSAPEARTGRCLPRALPITQFGANYRRADVSSASAPQLGGSRVSSPPRAVTERDRPPGLPPSVWASRSARETGPPAAPGGAGSPAPACPDSSARPGCKAAHYGQIPRP